MSTEEKKEEVQMTPADPVPENTEIEKPQDTTESASGEALATAEHESGKNEGSGNKNTETDTPQESQDIQAAAPGQDQPETAYSMGYEDVYRELYTEILEHLRSFSPSEEVAGRITEEHITEYLEGTREEKLLAFRERREKRILTALEILASLTAVVLTVWFLRDNPAILVNVLYLIGGLGIFFIWRYPNKKNDKKDD